MLIYWRVLQPPSHSRVYASWSRNGICSAEFYRGLWGFGQPLKGGGVVLCNWEAQKAMFIDRKRRWCCVFSLTFIDVHLHKYVYIYIYIYWYLSLGGCTSPGSLCCLCLSGEPSGKSIPRGVPFFVGALATRIDDRDPVVTTQKSHHSQLFCSYLDGKKT